MNNRGSRQLRSSRGRTVVQALSLLLICLLMCGCTSNPKSASVTSTSAQRPLGSDRSYVERLKQTFEKLRRAEPNFVCTRFNSQRGYEVVRVHTSGEYTQVEKANEVRKKLGETEIAVGKESVLLVPLLVQLAIVAQNDPHRQSYLDRAIALAEEEAKRGGAGEGALEAAEVLSAYIASTGYLRVAPTINSLQVSEVVLELMLGADGFTSEAVKPLLQVSQLLAQQGELTEAIELAKLGRDYLSNIHSREANAIGMTIDIHYADLLKQAGRSSEAKETEAQIEATRKKLAADVATQADQKTEKALERAEIDPSGLVTAQLQAALPHLEAGDKDVAYALFDKALSTYKTLETSNTDAAIDHDLNRFVATWLAQTKKKSDEQIIFKVVDAENQKAGKDNQPHQVLSTIVTYYCKLHRYKDATYLLQQALEKRKQLQPNGAAVQEVLALLDQVYNQSDLADKSLEIRIQSLSTAEAQYGKNDPHIVAPLLALAEKYRYKLEVDKARPLQARAASIILAADQIDQQQILELARFDVEINNLAEADALLRKGYEQSRSSLNMDSFTWLDQMLRTLMNKYEQLEEFAKAESVFDVAMKNRVSEKTKNGWARQLSTIYLKHAARLKREGKLAQSKQFLAKSNAEYKRELNRLKQLRTGSSSSACPADYESLRQSEVADLGLADVSSELTNKSEKKNE